MQHLKGSQLRHRQIIFNSLFCYLSSQRSPVFQELVHPAATAEIITQTNEIKEAISGKQNLHIFHQAYLHRLKIPFNAHLDFRIVEWQSTLEQRDSPRFERTARDIRNLFSFDAHSPGLIADERNQLGAKCRGIGLERNGSFTLVLKLKFKAAMASRRVSQTILTDSTYNSSSVSWISSRY